MQTAMIYGVLWDKTMDYIREQKTAGNTTYDVDIVTDEWYHGSSVVNSGQANPGTEGDVALNTWDLASNAYEWTQEATQGRGRICRSAGSAAGRTNSFYDFHATTNYPEWVSTRIIFYIK